MPRISVKGPPGSGKINLIMKGLESAGTPVQLVLCDQLDPLDIHLFKPRVKGAAFIFDNFSSLSEEMQDVLLRKVKERNPSNLVFTVETEA
jgi:Ni2+-binding GTPase involved in maturation of urease and hydrogenase